MEFFDGSFRREELHKEEQRCASSFGSRMRARAGGSGDDAAFRAPGTIIGSRRRRGCCQGPQKGRSPRLIVLFLPPSTALYYSYSSLMSRGHRDDDARETRLSTPVDDFAQRHLPTGSLNLIPRYTRVCFSFGVRAREVDVSVGHETSQPA